MNRSNRKMEKNYFNIHVTEMEIQIALKHMKIHRFFLW